MPRHAKLLFGYAAFLVVCGFLGWAASGFTEKAKTAILSGSATGGIVFAVAFLSTRRHALLASAGRGLGVFFPLAFGGVFIWRATVAWQDVAAGEPKVYVGVLLSAMATASLVTAGILVAWRARAIGRGATAGDASADAA
jgi:hypothetical protein